MSEPPKSLKDQNAPTIRLFVGGVVLAYIVAYVGADVVPDGLALSSLPGALDPLRAGAAAVGGVFSLLLLNLLPTPVKETLVYWRRRDVLPGSRAFTELGPRDARVDMATLESVHGPLPQVPQGQNQLWYQIYQKNESQPGVRDAQKSYLLYRELASVSLLLLALLLVGTLFAFALVPRDPGALEGLFTALLLGVYFLAAVNARNSGTRFVTNVLAVEGAKASGERPKSPILSR